MPGSFLLSALEILEGISVHDSESLLEKESDARGMLAKIVVYES